MYRGQLSVMIENEKQISDAIVQTETNIQESMVACFSMPGHSDLFYTRPQGLKEEVLLYVLRAVGSLVLFQSSFQPRNAGL